MSIQMSKTIRKKKPIPHSLEFFHWQLNFNQIVYRLILDNEILLDLTEELRLHQK